MKILYLHACEILDSRGNPTVEVYLTTKRGTVHASVPSGASTGKHEALELRDGGRRFHGMGVRKAVAHVNGPLRKALLGIDCTDQGNVDEILLAVDNSLHKSRMGANAILGASLAACKAGALESDLPLYGYIAQCFGRNPQGPFLMPVPAFNIINGGAHAGTKLDFQEYMVLPSKCRSFEEALRIGSEIYHELKILLKKRFGPTAVNVGDEGGFAPPLRHVVEPFELIMKSAERMGHANRIKLGIDCASSQRWNGKQYIIEGKKTSTEQLTNLYEDLVQSYPLVSIEDPFHEEDFEAFAVLRRRLPRGVQVVGDDLLCTNIARMCTAIEHGSVNALLLKVNQIGTVSEAMGATQFALSEGWNVMVSHRSGETTDDFIADLAVGLSTGQIKAGAPCRGERVAKYNRLLRIEEELGKRAVYGMPPSAK